MPKLTPSNENNHIRQFRLAAGLSQSELAEKADIGLSTLARYEAFSFMGRVPEKTREKLAAALGKSREQVTT